MTTETAPLRRRRAAPCGRAGFVRLIRSLPQALGRGVFHQNTRFPRLIRRLKITWRRRPPALRSDDMATKAKIGILGASGYTGSELVRLLLRHPRAELALLTADRRAGQEMRSVFPQFSPFDLPTLVSIDGLDWKAQGLDLVFCALPHATTQKVLKDLLADGAGHQGRRSVGGFPAERYRGLRPLVRARASRARTADGSRVRARGDP